MSEPAQKVIFNFEESEIISSESVTQWGKTLIVAPHPDDESLGCGGALALLRKYDCEVVALTISDGTLSHPNSIEFPAEKLRDLRETEMLAALEILGVGAEKVSFFRFRDRSVPAQSSPEFSAAVEKVSNYLDEHQPQTILVPWRNDPHPDHRATWQLFNQVNKLQNHRFRILEYPIWLWEMAEANDLPKAENIKIQRLNIESVTQIKQRAIWAHLSQITDLIKDDPHGFRLSPEMLAHFESPFEIYFEEIR